MYVNGSLELTPQPPVMDRFWSKVNKTETCWLWTGAADSAGYGSFRVSRGVDLGPHRFVAKYVMGLAIDGLHVDHKCHQPRCVNPDHLQAVTPQQNQENRRASTSKSISGVRGVSWNRVHKRWIARANVNGKEYYGGRFTTIAEAEVAAIALRNRVMTNNVVDRRAG